MTTRTASVARFSPNQSASRDGSELDAPGNARQCPFGFANTLSSTGTFCVIDVIVIVAVNWSVV